MEGFRDKAQEGLDRAEEEADERTGGRFDEQTDQARQRGEDYLGGDQGSEEGDGEQSMGDEQSMGGEQGGEQSSFDDEELDEGEDEAPY